MKSNLSPDRDAVVVELAKMQALLAKLVADVGAMKPFIATIVAGKTGGMSIEEALKMMNESAQSIFDQTTKELDSSGDKAAGGSH